MLKGVPSEDSPYTFTVRVVDSTWQGLAADCSVTVTIQDLPEEAVFNSGAVRLKGVCVNREYHIDRYWVQISILAPTQQVSKADS